MTTSINTGAEFYAWNGTTSAILTADITIDNTFTSKVLSNNKTFNGQYYTITVLSGPIPALFKYSGTQGAYPSISNFNYNANGFVPTNSYILCRNGNTPSLVFNLGNINIINANIDNTGVSVSLGGVLSSDFLQTNYSYITSVSISGVIKGKVGYPCGGICASGCNNVSITNCYIGCNIENYGAGILPDNPFPNGLSIDRCIFKGTIGENSGGLLGSSTLVTISNCYSICTSTATSDGSNTPGAIAAKASGNSILYCYFQLLGGTDHIYFIGSNYSSYTSLSDCTTPQGVFSILGNEILTDCVTNVVNSTATTGVPFTSFNSDLWNGLGGSSTVQNLTLKSFQASPWDPSVYVINTDTPSFTFACLLEGSLILTPNGEKLIEEIEVGDIINTISNTTTVVKITKIISAIEPHIIDKEFTKGKRDIYTSPTHALLVNGEWIHGKCYNFSRDNKKSQYTYYHIKTNSEDDLIIVDGVISETLRKDGFKCKYCS